MAVIALKPETQRKPGPYKAERTCSSCGAQLSRYNPSSACAPCSGGEWIEGEGEVTEAQIKQLRVARLEELGVAA